MASGIRLPVQTQWICAWAASEGAVALDDGWIVFGGLAVVVT